MGPGPQDSSPRASVLRSRPFPGVCRRRASAARWPLLVGRGGPWFLCPPLVARTRGRLTFWTGGRCAALARLRAARARPAAGPVMRCGRGGSPPVWRSGLGAAAGRPLGESPEVSGPRPRLGLIHRAAPSRVSRGGSTLSPARGTGTPGICPGGLKAGIDSHWCCRGGMTARTSSSSSSGDWWGRATQ